jgi:hypothetical protein
MTRLLNFVLSRATSSAHGQVVRTAHGQRSLSDVGRENHPLKGRVPVRIGNTAPHDFVAAPRPISGDRVNRCIAASAFFIGATVFWFAFFMEASR